MGNVEKFSHVRYEVIEGDIIAQFKTSCGEVIFQIFLWQMCHQKIFKRNIKEILLKPRAYQKYTDLSWQVIRPNLYYFFALSCVVQHRHHHVSDFPQIYIIARIIYGSTNMEITTEKVIFESINTFGFTQRR